MESVSTTLDPKGFNSLLNGLHQLLFGGAEEDFAAGVQLLQEKIFKTSSLDPQEQRNEISLFEAILRRASQDNWTADQLQDFLNRRSFPSDHTNVFLRFWSKESSQVILFNVYSVFATFNINITSLQIHRVLLKRTTFNNNLDSFSWRVDMNAMSKASAELNEPIASFELNFVAQAKPPSSARFDMSRDELSSLLQSMQNIQNTFETIVQQGAK